MTEDPDPVTVTADGVRAQYYETDHERILAFDYDNKTAAIAQNIEGYAMLKVRADPEGSDIERYYGFDMALDHVAELLELRVSDLPIPDDASDMGM